MKTTNSTRVKPLSISLLVIFLWLLIPGQPETLHAEKLSQDPRCGIQDTGHMDRASCIMHHVSCPKWKSLCKLGDLLGNQDAILVADAKGRILFSKDADKKLVPASSLKILTALVALHYLGPDYRFATEFYLDKNLNLKIKGYGDPLFISEILAEISKHLAARTIKINDLILDDSYFDHPIIIPGISSSSEPYDAPNGALCVNFNTVNFKRVNGDYVSAEPQTPLLPFATKRINESALDQGRIILSHNEKESTRYSGLLLQYFLKKEGIQSSGRIRRGRIRKETDKLAFRYISKFSLTQIISRLLEYSNNFIANQILIAAGAKAYGPPGTLAKGVRAASRYAKNVLKTEDICIVEGSGISRKNRVSAKSMHKIIEAFEPYRNLLRHTGREFYKTGTLTGVHTRAGYIENRKGELYRFVVLINTPGKSTENIMKRLLKYLGC